MSTNKKIIHKFEISCDAPDGGMYVSQDPEDMFVVIESTGIFEYDSLCAAIDVLESMKRKLDALGHVPVCTAIQNEEPPF